MSTAALPSTIATGPDTVLRDELRTTWMVWLRAAVQGSIMLATLALGA